MLCRRDCQDNIRGCEIGNIGGGRHLCVNQHARQKQRVLVGEVHRLDHFILARPEDGLTARACGDLGQGSAPRTAAYYAYRGHAFAPFRPGT